MVLENSLSVQIKGIRDGLLIMLESGAWNEMEGALFEHIKEKENFFKGAKITLDVGDTVLRASDISSLRDKLSEKEMSLYAVISSSTTTKQNAKTLGLLTQISMMQTEPIEKSIDTSVAGENAVMIQRTLRSGFQVSYKGHVVVIGDVNPGAEVIASGSIVVWGKVRGVIHAGAEGDEKAVVCAMDLDPTQLRIAGYISIPPAKKGKPQPEIAYIKDGKLVAESWNYKEGGR